MDDLTSPLSDLGGHEPKGAPVMGKAEYAYAAELTEQVTGTEGRKVVVGVRADPGLPAAVADRPAEGLPDLLSERVGAMAVRWRPEVARAPFEVRSPDYEHLADNARERVRSTTWDLGVCVTDAPLPHGNAVVLAEVDAQDAPALPPPTLGEIDLVRRTRRQVAVLGHAPGSGRAGSRLAASGPARRLAPAASPRPAGRGRRRLRYRQRDRRG